MRLRLLRGLKTLPLSCRKNLPLTQDPTVVGCESKTTQTPGDQLNIVYTFCLKSTDIANFDQKNDLNL